VIGAGGSGGGSNVEVQLVGRLQAVRAEPHHFLTCLPTPPAMVLGIDQAAPCLPRIGGPRRGHLVFAVASTQRNPEPCIPAMGYGPVAHCRGTRILSGIERRRPLLSAVRRIEENAHGTPCPVQPRLGETVLPVAAQEAHMLEPHLQFRAEPGSWPRRCRAWSPLPVWETCGVGRSPAFFPKPEPAQVEAQ
jgi:hypothetical protein